MCEFDSVDAEADLGVLREQIAALEAQVTVSEEQLPTVEQQLGDVQSLYEKGYGRKPQLFELQRQVTQLKGDIAANKIGSWLYTTKSARPKRRSREQM